MEYQYNIAGHLCRIVFCDAGNDSSLLPSFSPFESEEEGNLLFCLSVDDAFRWPVTGEEVGQVRLRWQQLRGLPPAGRELSI